VKRWRPDFRIIESCTSPITVKLPGQSGLAQQSSVVTTVLLSISLLVEPGHILLFKGDWLRSIEHLKLRCLEALSKMDRTFSPRTIPIPYVQENTSQTRHCQHVDCGQSTADFYGQHHKTESAYLAPEYFLNVAYTKRCDIDTTQRYDIVGVRERITQMFANQNYQNDLELMLGFNTDIEATQGVALQSNQQVSPTQSIHLNIPDQTVFEVDGRRPETVSNTESFYHPG